MKETTFKISCIALAITLVATLTFVILMACNICNWELQPFIWFGLALYGEGVALYLTKKLKKNDTDD